MLHSGHNDSGPPPLSRDPAFLGMTLTQLLGAFNDNVFKQLLVLYYLGIAATDELANTYQAIAFMVFSLPFVLFSGLAGWWSDRVVKRNIVIGSKVAEIGVMVLGLLAFLSGNLYAPFVVLFLMATQSTFFGPSKYGILPEMLRERDLPAANGIVQMTTFLAIIFGVVVAGVGKKYVETDLAEYLPGPNSPWVLVTFCIGIAVVGTFTATLLRRTPIAHPGLPFSVDALFLSRETTKSLREDHRLRNALLVVSVFWFVAGVVQLTTNEYGKRQLGADDAQTSLLLAGLSVGIAIGCATTGSLSRHRVQPAFVTCGALGIAVTLLGLTFVGFADASGTLSRSSILLVSGLLLFATGCSTGFFVVPLQVILQVRSPRALKGRIIAAQNLLNFIGLFAAGGFYWALGQFFKLDWVGLPISTVFGVTAIAMFAIAIGYHPSGEMRKGCPVCGELLVGSGDSPCPACGGEYPGSTRDPDYSVASTNEEPRNSNRAS